MTDTKKVSATLEIHVYVNCPHCDYYIDLLDESDTDGVLHNDCGEILKQTCPTDGTHWSDARLEVEEVTCSECKGVFDVEGVEW